MTIVKSLKHEVDRVGHGRYHRTHRSMKGRKVIPRAIMVYKQKRREISDAVSEREFKRAKKLYKV